MVRWLYILSICAMVAAFGVLGPWWCERGKVDPEVAEFLNRPSAIQRFIDQGNGSGDRPAEVSPLVAQAKAFALYLNPAKSPDKPSASGSAVNSLPPAAADSRGATIQPTTYRLKMSRIT